MNLTKFQKKALRLTQRGNETFIVGRDDYAAQPIDISMAILELPELVRLGLMTCEDLDGDRKMYRITEAGRSAGEADV